MKKTNKILAFALALLLALSMLPVTAFASDVATASTDSTESIAISSADEFLAMESGKSYYLTDSFTLPAKTGEAYIDKFYGVLDGRGETITLQLTATDDPERDSNGIYAGLFGQLGTESSDTHMTTIVTNLNVAGSIVFETTDCSVYAFIGGLAAVTNGRDATGNIASVYLENVNSNVDITVSNDQGADVYVGGLIAYVCKMNATNCSYNGTITVTNPAACSTYVGGLFGRIHASDNGNDYYRNVIKYCTNAGTVTVSVADKGENNSWQGVGGIVGLIQRSAHILDCTNTGTVNYTDYGTDNNNDAVADIVGVVHGKALTLTVTIADCKGVKDAVVGDTETLDDTDRLFIYNCTYGNDNTECTQNLPIRDFNNTDHNEKNSVIEIKTAEDFAKIGADSSYPANAFYILNGENGVIEFGQGTGNVSDSTYTTSVIQEFSGVLYGNDNAIVGIDFDNTNASSKDISLIYKIANTADAVVMNLSLGTEDRPIDYVTVSGQAGILASISNYNGSGNYHTFISDVDVYGNFTANNSKTNIAMFVGKGWDGITVCDSNAYGKVSQNGRTSWMNICGFIGQMAGAGNGEDCTLINCNNYVNISSAKDGAVSGNATYAGFIALLQQSSQLIGCNNFGDIINSNNDANMYIGAFVAEIRTTGDLTIYGSNNYGELSNYGSTTNVGIMAGLQNSNLSSVRLINVTDYSSGSYLTIGKVNSGKTGTPIVTDYADNGAITVNTLNSAAIRINADETKAGMRFKAEISDNAAEGLKKAFGSDAVVSYGIIITPTVFKEAVIAEGKEFTANALDAWAAGISSFGDDKAYVDIEVADGNWYQGKNGTIAASVNGLHGAEGSEKVNLFDASFSARAYIKVTVDGEVAYKLYGTANDGAVFTDILGKALGDVLYSNNNGVTLYTDEACTALATEDEDLTAEEIATYTVDVTDDDNATVKKYTCYTAQQYADLTTLQKTISEINNSN